MADQRRFALLHGSWPRRTASVLALGSACAAFVVAKADSNAGQPGSELAQLERLPVAVDALPGTVPSTLVDFESLALGNHPAIARAAAQVDAARGRWVQAGLYPNPRAGYVAEEIGNEDSAGMHGAMFGQEIVRGGKLQLSRNVARCDIARANELLETERQRVLNEVGIEFYNVLAAQQAQELAEELLEVGKRGAETTQQLFNAQEASRVEVLQAEIEAESASVASQAARNRYLAAWQRLAAAIAMPNMQPVRLEGDLTADLPELEWQSSLDRILAVSPELSAARVAVSRARARVRREQVESIGNLDVEAGVMHDFATEDAFATVRAMVPLPWHNRNQGNIQEADAEVREALGELRRLELDLQKRLAAAFERYSNARFQVERYSKTILPNARRSLELVNVGYRQGEFNFLTVLTAQRTYFQTNLTYLAAVRELRESTIAIEGLLITGETSSPMPISQRIESRQSAGM